MHMLCALCCAAILRFVVITTVTCTNDNSCFLHRAPLSSDAYPACTNTKVGTCWVYAPRPTHTFCLTRQFCCRPLPLGVHCSFCMLRRAAARQWPAPTLPLPSSGVGVPGRLMSAQPRKCGGAMHSLPDHQALVARLSHQLNNCAARTISTQASALIGCWRAAWKKCLVDQ